MTNHNANCISNDASVAALDPDSADSFQLYDLRVEVVCSPGKRIMCGAKDGDYFILEGEMLKLPPGQGISIYSLGLVLPLLAAKQRVSSPNDWISTDAEVACPGPDCPSRLRIIRTSIRTYKHGDVTTIHLRNKENESKEFGFIGTQSRTSITVDASAL